MTRFRSPLLLFPALAVASHAATREVSFEKDVRPILKAHCTHCHGEEEKPKGGVDLRLRRFMDKELDGGLRVLVPGQPDKREMILLVREGEMPREGKPLTPEQIAVLEKWIAQGAKATQPEPETLPPGMFITDTEREFWSFKPIARPAVPDVRNQESGVRGQVAQVSNPQSAIRNPIDAFILAKLREQKLDFAPEADKATLIRRLTLDLTGLPPTPAEVDAFVNDTSPGAYEKVADRLLGSQSYGERWARHWLDVSGYADSNGYTEADSVRPHAWRYRDYVIRSLNADKPWNEFITEQLAGDELAGVSGGADDFRRSMCVQARRKTPLTVLETFDEPVMQPNCEQRTRTTVAPQSLMMMNDTFVLDTARSLAKRLRADAPDNTPAQIAEAWRILFSRTPQDADVQRALAYVTAQTEAVRACHHGVQHSKDKPAPDPPSRASRATARCSSVRTGSSTSIDLTGNDPARPRRCFMWPGPFPGAGAAGASRTGRGTAGFEFRARRGGRRGAGVQSDAARFEIEARISLPALGRPGSGLRGQSFALRRWSPELQTRSFGLDFSSSELGLQPSARPFEHPGSNGPPFFSVLRVPSSILAAGTLFSQSGTRRVERPVPKPDLLAPGFELFARKMELFSAMVQPFPGENQDGSASSQAGCMAHWFRGSGIGGRPGPFHSPLSLSTLTLRLDSARAVSAADRGARSI